MELYPLLEEASPFYSLLRRHALQPLATPSLAAPLPRPTLPLARNEQILVWVRDRLLPREAAVVSVLDSSVQGGDAVWEVRQLRLVTVVIVLQSSLRIRCNL